ncbi:MAG: 4Fe-4S ferredoxin [Desulfobulbaceae bacterium]|uniref:4Fe-4S ferredoxin n=1 Tax=Candidatus Desulfatifera sulfidica TaxID=2841691 RepID=A0A8J6T9C7_9BACT|nr:4Fe-4S ferredoxin [Candidatus Desulfatifera sulfidica]
MKNVRKIIKIDEELCDGCGLCVPDCAEGSLQIIDGKARLVADNLCDGLGACLGSCPTGALQIIEREADEFDEDAVEEFLANQKKQANSVPEKPSGCPSAQLKTFAPTSPCQTANKPSLHAAGGPSALRHWPVQIRLIPPTAPFLQGADVLVAADCSAVTAANFQEEFLQDKVVMMGCPKFDDAQSYVEKFTAIIDQCNLKSITILIMEVPCCASMNVIIKEALKQSAQSVAVEQITLSVRGEIVSRNQW